MDFSLQQVTTLVKVTAYTAVQVWLPIKLSFILDFMDAGVNSEEPIVYVLDFSYDFDGFDL